jgi:hypothetical protein
VPIITDALELRNLFVPNRIQQLFLQTYDAQKGGIVHELLTLEGLSLKFNNVARIFGKICDKDGGMASRKVGQDIVRASSPEEVKVSDEVLKYKSIIERENRRAFGNLLFRSKCIHGA